MDPQDRELLQRTLQLSEENNTMLRKMRRSMRVSNVLRLVYWLVIIGLSIGAFYYIQPYVDQLLGVYTGFQTDYSSVQNVIKQFGGGAQ